jgi:ABC-type multidrug transport system fused ATPase/permease subunit
VLRDKNLIFLTVRVLLFLFFLSLSINKPINQKATIIVLSSIYLSLSMYLYLYPGRLKLFKNYGDLALLALLTFVSGQKEAVFAMAAPISLYANRSPTKALLALWVALGTVFYYYGTGGILLAPLLFALYLSPIYPELVEGMRKERYYIRNLRNSYRELAKEQARIEKELEENMDMRGLIEDLLNSRNLEEYLKAVKGRFNLKAINIVQKTDLQKDTLLDRSSLSVHVPISLDKGRACVIFYLNNPLELYDQKLIKSLERSARFINLYVEGFEEPSKGSVKIAL